MRVIYLGSIALCLVLVLLGCREGGREGASPGSVQHVSEAIRRWLDESDSAEARVIKLLKVAQPRTGLAIQAQSGGFHVEWDADQDRSIHAVGRVEGDRFVLLALRKGLPRSRAIDIVLAALKGGAAPPFQDLPTPSQIEAGEIVHSASGRSTLLVHGDGGERWGFVIDNGVLRPESSWNSIP